MPCGRHLSGVAVGFLWDRWTRRDSSNRNAENFSKIFCVFCCNRLLCRVRLNEFQDSRRTIKPTLPGGHAQPTARGTRAMSRATPGMNRSRTGMQHPWEPEPPRQRPYRVNHDGSREQTDGQLETVPPSIRFLPRVPGNRTSRLAPSVQIPWLVDLFGFDVSVCIQTRGNKPPLTISARAIAPSCRAGLPSRRPRAGLLGKGHRCSD